MLNFTFTLFIEILLPIVSIYFAMRVTSAMCVRDIDLSLEGQSLFLCLQEKMIIFLMSMTMKFKVQLENSAWLTKSCHLKIYMNLV